MDQFSQPTFPLSVFALWGKVILVVRWSADIRDSHPTVCMNRINLSGKKSVVFCFQFYPEQIVKVTENLRFFKDVTDS